MYVEIKDEKLLSWCKNPYSDYAFVDIDYDSFDPEKYEVQNGELTDISSTAAYIAKIAKRENEEKQVKLFAEIEDLDKKRIRAIAEPEIKDSSTGQTWLEYYTLQIKDLRNQITALA